MKARIILFLFLVAAVNSFSQNQNSVWCFGDSAGIDFININNPMPLVSSMDGRGSCVSFSDTSGILSFYANHNSLAQAKAWNYLNDTLQNSDSLLGDGYYGGLVLIPKPLNDSLYYLFSLKLSGHGLYYNIVNLKYNNGSGIIVQKNILLNSVDIADCLTAIQHGNGRDWWLIAKLSNGSMNNRFFVYLINSIGISPPFIQNFNNATNVGFQKLVFNSNGTKLMQITLASFMCEFNFDRCSGILSNPSMIFPESTGALFWEGSYSSNDSVFYVTTIPDPNSLQAYLFQYNLSALNIPLSCDTLDVFSSPIGTGAVRLAPDGKIYFSRAYECNAFPYCYPYPDSARNYVNENLSVINYPDSLGSACAYQPFSFYLGGKRTYYGLPNNPDYTLGVLAGSPCDSLGVGIENIEQEKSNAALYIFYHSSWHTAFINVKELKGKNYKMRVHDLLGNLIFKEEGKLNSEYFTKDLKTHTFSKGMYIVAFETEKEKLVKKFVVD